MLLLQKFFVRSSSQYTFISEKEVHMTRVLHTARISDVGNVMFVDRIRGMVSFELGKEIEENIFSSCHERGTKETQTFGFRASMLYHSTTITMFKTYNTCPAYC